MKLKEYEYLGKADSKNENDKIFEEAYYDEYNYVDKLVNDCTFLVVGRKGFGKTALYKKFKLDNADKINIKIDNFSLRDIDLTLLDDLKNNNHEGSKKYYNIWKWMIFIEIFKYINNTSNLIKKKGNKFNNIVEILKNNNIYLNEAIGVYVRKLIKNKGVLKIPYLEVEVEKEYGTKKINTYGFIEHMKNAINDVEFINNSNKFFMFIDGLDDALTLKKSEYLDLIGGLITAAYDINTYLSDKKINIKVIILLRTDIFLSLFDPDLNKIRQDCKIDLTSNYKSLKAIVKLRLLINNINLKDKFPWYDIFPKKINQKDSWAVFVDHTFLRPRDAIMFLLFARDMYPDNELINHYEFMQILKKFCTDYFVSELKDELVGKVDREILHNLNSILISLGNESFKYIDFETICKKSLSLLVNQEVDDNIIYNLFTNLVNSSCIGQNSRINDKIVLQFNYLHPRMIINREKSTYKLHRGIINGII